MSVGSIAAPHAVSSGHLAAALSPRRRYVWYALIPALALLLHSLVFWRGIPFPTVHDEFSYLLAADTFASGRLANPTPAHPEFFETFHENMIPRYVSKYPPAQGLALALGQALFGHPWYGVELSMLAMFAALAWCLYGWLPPAPALVCSLLAVVVHCNTYWMNSYMGGAVSAFAGCLIVGAIPRLWRRASATSALAFALGLVILANSRPFEGLALAMGIFAALAIGPHRWMKRLAGARVLAPFLLVLALGAAWMLIYNRATTGSALRMAYLVNQEQYASAPQLWILPESGPPKTYRHAVMRELWEGWYRPIYRAVRRDPLREKALDFIGSALFLTPGPLFLLFAGGILVLVRTRRPRRWILLLPIAAVAAAVALNVGAEPHYFSPAFAAVFVVAGLGVHRLSMPGRIHWFAWALICVLLGAWMLWILRADRIVALIVPNVGRGRAEAAASLAAQGPRHLVFVQYTPDHNVHREWVYNDADMSRSAVIWARDMGPDADRVLSRSLPGRKAWVATVSGASLKSLAPFASEESQWPQKP